MKRILPVIVSLMIARPLAVCSAVNEQTFTETINGTTFSCKVSSGTKAVITECSSDMEEIIIPSSLGGYAITSIGEKAFFGKVMLTSVIIPESITYIGDNAFSGCLSLESVVLPETLTYMGDECFTSCTSLKYVKLSSSLRTLPDRCFSSCTALDNIEIPDSVKSIGDEVFFGCSDISDIFIPPTVETIGENALGMYYNIRNNGIEKIKNFRIRGLPDTSASTYAIDTGVEIYNKSGDVDYNGFIDAIDASLVLSEYSLLSTNEKGLFDKYQQYVGDYNRDGIVDAVDSAVILQEYARLQTLLTNEN